MTGTAGQKRVSNDFIENYVICFPKETLEQQAISDFLTRKTSQIDEIISKSRRMIELLGEKRSAVINMAVTGKIDLREWEPGNKNFKLKPYPKYKDSGIEWLGNVPDGWEVRKISRSFNIIGSGTTPPTDELEYYEDGTINWVITGDLNDNVLEDTSKKISPLALKKFSTLKMYPENSLLIAMYWATIGKIGILNIEACVNQACCVLSGSKYFDIKFVFYWFLANRENIIKLSYGGGQPNINQEIIKSLKIFCPKNKEQKKIAEYLDSYHSKIDHTISKIESQISLLQEYRTALISNAVTGKIDVRETITI